MLRGPYDFSRAMPAAGMVKMRHVKEEDSELLELRRKN